MRDGGVPPLLLFERKEFPGKNFFYIWMIVPLVIPGVILGISILALLSVVAQRDRQKFA